MAVDLEGRSEVIARMPSYPFSIDWLPDGRLLITNDRSLLRRELDGSIVTHVDLTDVCDHPWNEIVVDGRGNIYVNNIAFDFPRRRLRGHAGWPISVSARTRRWSGVAADRARDQLLACMLGGDDGKTLFMMVADWHAADSIDDNLDRLINGPHTGKVPAAAAWASQ